MAGVGDSRIEGTQSILLMESSSSGNRGMSVFLEGDGPGRPTIFGRVGIIHKSSFMVYRVLGVTDGGLRTATAEYKQTIETGSQLDVRKEVCPILLAKWLRTSGRTILVISTKHQLHFYDSSATKLLGQFDKFSSQNSLTGPVRAVDAADDDIFTGSDEGDLTHFKYEATKSTVSLESTKVGAQSGQIYDVCTNGVILASGNSQGNISIWNVPNLAKVVHFQTDSAECVTNCIIWSHFVIGSYETGIIRIYDLRQKCLATLIRAHSRWISSMDLATNSATLLTIAEDNWVRIWQLQENNLKVRHKASVKLANLAPVGARFLDNEGASFAVNCYANKELFIFNVS